MEAVGGRAGRHCRHLQTGHMVRVVQPTIKVHAGTVAVQELPGSCSAWSLLRCIRVEIVARNTKGCKGTLLDIVQYGIVGASRPVGAGATIKRVTTDSSDAWTVAGRVDADR
jgi:hypothetical protein